MSCAAALNRRHNTGNFAVEEERRGQSSVHVQGLDALCATVRQNQITPRLALLGACVLIGLRPAMHATCTHVHVCVCVAEGAHVVREEGREGVLPGPLECTRHATTHN